MAIRLDFGYKARLIGGKLGNFSVDKSNKHVFKQAHWVWEVGYLYSCINFTFYIWGTFGRGYLIVFFSIRLRCSVSYEIELLIRAYFISLSN